MSDMAVVLIKEVAAVDLPKAQAAAKVLEAQIFSEIAKEKTTFKPRKTKSSKNNDIVFEPPSVAETKKYSGEQSKTLSDGLGRSRWIVTRECWCSHEDPKECKITTPVGPCPNKPYAKHAPRRLWATNPDFGKPREEAVEEKEAEVEAVN